MKSRPLHAASAIVTFLTLSAGPVLGQLAAGTLTLTGGNGPGEPAIHNPTPVFLNAGRAMNVAGSPAAGPFIGSTTIADGATVVLQPASGSALAIGNITIGTGATLIIRGSDAVKFTGTVLNNGTVRTDRGATLDASGATGFVNNGTIDLISGTMQLPATLTHGPAARLLDARAIQVRTAVHQANQFTLTVDGITGHTYQLQHTSSLDQSFTNTGNPQTGTGAPLTFQSNTTTATRGFYRVVIDQ